MKKLLLLLFIFLISLGAFAQKKLPKFGDVSVEDLKMVTYEADTSAVAVILFDKGSTNLNESDFPYRRHVRIKILKNAGLSWVDQTLRYDADEQILGLKGASYNLESGKVVESKMDSKSIFKSRLNRYSNQVKFTLPNVKVGTVIEYTYTITGGHIGWKFQYTIPVIWSQYEVNSSQYITLQKDMQGYLVVAAHEQKGDVEFFGMSNIPAFKEEPFITTIDDYVSKITFYLSSIFIPGNPVQNYEKSWNEQAKELDELSEFGGQIRGSGFLSKTVEELTAGVSEPMKKVQVIYDYVKSNVQWNEETDRIPDHNFKKVLEAKKGSSSEINLMMLCMLKKAGINAVPVFISTRDNGMVRFHLSRISQFNDVIVMLKITDKPIFLDATNKDLPMNVLPERCLNGEGLVIDGATTSQVTVVSQRSRVVNNLELKMDENGELAGVINISRDGIAAGDFRTVYRDLGEEKYLKEWLSGKTWEVSKNAFENIGNPTESVKEKHEVVIRDHAQANGPVIYLNPIVTGRMEENVFKSESRLYPVDYTTPFERVYLCKIKVPEGYEVEELPKPRILMFPGGGAKYVYTVTQNAGVISVLSQFTITKTKFTAEEYPHLREFYSQMVAKQAEQLVIKKKQ